MLLNEKLFESGDFKEFEQEGEPAQDSLPDVEAEVVTDSEIKPEGPEQGEATGISNIIHDLIIDENQAIQGYNNAAANMEHYPELQKIMQDIASEEFAHIGELQKALEILSPNASNIQEGEVETEENLDKLSEEDPGSPVDESLKLEEDKSSAFEKLDAFEKIAIIKSFVENYEGTTIQEDFMKEYGEDSLDYLYYLDDLMFGEGQLLITSRMERDSEYGPNAPEYEYLTDFQMLARKIQDSKFFQAAKEYVIGLKNKFRKIKKEELEEALYISDDMKVLRLIDKAIKNSDAGSKLTDAEAEDLSNLINELLHSTGEKKPKEYRYRK